MPYIKKIDRERIDSRLRGLPDAINNAGELNYAISTLIAALLQKKWERDGKWGYADLNEIVGALDSAKAEFQRRVVGPYEDTKIRENGDVFENVMGEDTNCGCPRFLTLLGKHTGGCKGH